MLLQLGGNLDRSGSNPSVTVTDSFELSGRFDLLMPYRCFTAGNVDKISGQASRSIFSQHQLSRAPSMGLGSAGTLAHRSLRSVITLWLPTRPQ